jgi:hypothetical protein
MIVEELNVRVARGVACRGRSRRDVGCRREGIIGAVVKLRAGMEEEARDDDVALAAKRSSAAGARGIAVRSISARRRCVVYVYMCIVVCMGEWQVELLLLAAIWREK